MNKIAPEKEHMNSLFTEAESFKPLPPSAADVITAEPEDLEIVSTTSNYRYLTPEDPEVVKENVDQGIRTLRDVAADNDARAADRITAAKALLESAGMLGKGSTVNVIRANNAQINNQSPQEDAKLLKALSQIGTLLDATDAEINLTEGGKGA
jgi:hypothetical protein